MSEGPPKIESKEGAERPPQYRVLERKILETYEDGSKKEEITECNSHSHRHCVDIISYDDKGEVTYVEELVRGDLGPCDGQHS